MQNAAYRPDQPRDILVCFAVKEEARPFRKLLRSGHNVRTFLTGVGKVNAEKAIRKALTHQKPSLVLSCGFAGGLSPELAAGTVVFALDAQPALASALLSGGARPVRFHCADHIIVSAKEKEALWKSTGADAVEMESQVICSICGEQDIPSGIVRVILDPASEDLPLDFNELMSSRNRMNYVRLALALFRSPDKALPLLQLQKDAETAARALGKVLHQITAR